MNKFYTALMQTAVVATLLGAATNTAKAQLFKNLELGGGLSMGAGNITSSNRYFDPANPNIISGDSKSQSFNYRSGYVNLNTYFPLAYFRAKRMLALSVGLMGTTNEIQIDNAGLDPAIGSDVLKNTFVGMPIGVDYIYGGEATRNKANKISLRAGIGVMPYMDMSKFTNYDGTSSKYSVTPYIKGELGLFAGIEWKIKGQVLFGTRTIYDAKVGDYTLQDTPTYSSFECKLQPSYTIGLAIMPFSMGWRGGREKW